MIAATRIETPEVERPDLWIDVSDEINKSGEGYFTSLALLYQPKGHTSGPVFLLPGTRREKATKALMEALAEWHQRRKVYAADSALVMGASVDVDTAFSALLALDAEGVKP